MFFDPRCSTLDSPRFAECTSPSTLNRIKIPTLSFSRCWSSAVSQQVFPGPFFSPISAFYRAPFVFFHLFLLLETSLFPPPPNDGVVVRFFSSLLSSLPLFFLPSPQKRIFWYTQMSDCVPSSSNPFSIGASAFFFSKSLYPMDELFLNVYLHSFETLPLFQKRVSCDLERSLLMNPLVVVTAGFLMFPG